MSEHSGLFVVPDDDEAAPALILSETVPSPVERSQHILENNNWFLRFQQHYEAVDFLDAGRGRSFSLDPDPHNLCELDLNCDSA